MKQCGAKVAKPSITLVAAMSRNRVIGYQNRLPWHLPADLRYFREVTKGKTVIMGRKTFDSIGNKPLPNRRNIIITHDTHAPSTPGYEIAGSLDEALTKAQNNASEIMIIGGQSIYEQALDKATDIYITLIDAEIQGDTFFPEWNPDEWEEVERSEHQADHENPYHFCFLKLKKISKESRAT